MCVCVCVCGVCLCTYFSPSLTSLKTLVPFEELQSKQTSSKTQHTEQPTCTGHFEVTNQTFFNEMEFQIVKEKQRSSSWHFCYLLRKICSSKNTKEFKRYKSNTHNLIAIDLWECGPSTICQPFHKVPIGLAYGPRTRLQPQLRLGSSPETCLGTHSHPVELSPSRWEVVLKILGHILPTERGPGRGLFCYPPPPPAESASPACLRTTILGLD